MPNLKLVTRIMLPAVLFFASAVGNIVAMGNEKPVFSGEVTDSVSKETLAGANISVITPNDTVWTVSDEKGLFSISVPKADKYWVSAYFVGYTAWKKEYRLPTENIKILLSPSSDKIDEAVLKEEVPVMIEKDDTVVYNLAPIPKMRGDMAGDVIARLPGIEISGDRILALGREVSRVLVNNTSLFGNDNTAAMKNLEAKEVRQVEVYDLVRSSDMDDSERIMNILTEHPLDRVIAGEVLLSGGTDGEQPLKERLKYGAGADFNYFSIQNIFNASVSGDNMNRESNSIRDINKSLESYTGYEEKETAKAHYEGRFSGIMIDADYGYSHNFNEQESIDNLTYFPTDMFPERMQNDTVRNSSSRRVHDAKLHVNWSGPISISSYTDFRYEETHRDDFRSSFSSMGEDILGRTGLHTPEHENSYSVSEMIALGLFESDKTMVDAHFNFDMKNDNLSGFRIDDMVLTSSPLNQKTAGRHKEFGAEGDIMLNQRIAKGLTFDFKYGLKYGSGNKYRLSESLLNGTLDSTDMYNNRFYNLSHVVSADLSYRKKKTSYTIGVSGNFTNMLRTEYFFENDNVDKWFNSVLPHASVAVYFDSWSQLFLSYLSNAQYPTLDMLTDRVNSILPLNIIAGNPLMEQCTVHQISGTYRKTNVTKGSHFEIGLTTKYIHNFIGQSSWFYTEDTPAMTAGGVDYMIPAGATVRSFQNMDGSLSAKFESKYSAHSRKLKSKLNFRIAADYNSLPYMNQGEKHVTESITPLFRFDYQSNFSKVFRMNLSSATSYYNSWGTMDTERLSETVLLRTTVSFLKNGYAACDYQGAFSFNLQGPGSDIYIHNLNFKVGWYLTDNWNVCIAVYDALNRDDLARERTLADHVAYSWSNSFGRCISLNISYRFNVTKKADLSDIDFE